MIVSNLKLESESIYEDLKSSIRLHKGSLVEGSKSNDKEDEDEVFYGEGKRGGFPQQNFRGRSKSDNKSLNTNPLSETSVEVKPMITDSSTRGATKVEVGVVAKVMKTFGKLKIFS